MEDIPIKSLKTKKERERKIENLSVFHKFSQSNNHGGSINALLKSTTHPNDKDIRSTCIKNIIEILGSPS